MARCLEGLTTHHIPYLKLNRTDPNESLPNTKSSSSQSFKGPKMENNGDEWLALDKLEHVLFCFFISIFVSSIAYLSPFSLLRRWSIWIGSLASIAAGAAKEAGDEIGFWHSAGASAKDAVADLLGVAIAVLVLSVWRWWSRRRSRKIKPDEESEEMV
ncbi:hypothetical protein Syun_025335 [Stephania yunnanensis]|uniref:Transmembrane protein n=1 Tax=Stephania yunnanensis TaxID=152371 RepID=A0AAP0ERG7_9MAGN